MSFELATRKKLRFNTNKGVQSVEDLWDLSLQSLDVIAKELNKHLKESEESFISEVTNKQDVETKIKFDIVCHIIKVKLDEKKAKDDRLVKEEKRRQLRDIIAAKQNQELEGKSLEELNKLLEEVM